MIAEFEHIAAGIASSKLNRREEFTVVLAQVARRALEDADFRAVLRSYPQRYAVEIGVSFALELAWLQAPRDSEGAKTPERWLDLAQEHDRKLAVLEREVVAGPYEIPRQALNRTMQVVRWAAEGMKVIHRPELYGKRGRAAASPQSATSGWAVRRVARFVREEIPKRYSIIARLVTKFSGSSVTPQNVRGILLKGRT